MNSANCTWSLLSSTAITRRAEDVEECHRRRSGVLVLLQTSPVSVILLHINDRYPPPSVRPPTESWRGTEPLSVCMSGLRRRPNLRLSVQPTKPCIIYRLPRRT